jgi:hypothetical protein
MDRKDGVMNTLQETKPSQDLSQHRYRYLANLGTFHAHDWIRRPKEARNSDLASLRRAEELLRAAIELNPDAHFGREKYQLMAIEWLQRDLDELENTEFTGPMGPDLRQLPDGAPTIRSVSPASHPLPFPAAALALESLEDCELLPALAASCWVVVKRSPSRSTAEVRNPLAARKFAAADA